MNKRAQDSPSHWDPEPGSCACSRVKSLSASWHHLIGFIWAQTEGPCTLQNTPHLKSNETPVTSGVFFLQSQFSKLKHWNPDVPSMWKPPHVFLVVPAPLGKDGLGWVWARDPGGQTAHLESPDCTKAMPGRSVDLPSLQFMLGFVVQFVPFSGLGCVCPQLEIRLFLRTAVCSAH